MRYIGDHAVDLLITDICMPGSSGLELLECVKSARNIYDERLIHSYNQDKIFFRNHIFQRLLNGEINAYKFEEQCELAGVLLNVPAWQVALVNIRSLEEGTCISLMNRFRSRKQEGYYCFLDGDMNLVFLFFDKRISAEGRENRRFLRQETGAYDIFICVGSTLQTYRQITMSYQVCREFMNAGILFHERNVYVGNYAYEKYLNIAKSKELQKLLQSLKEYDMDSLLSRMQRIIQQCRTEKEKQAELICLAVFLLNGIISVFPSRNIPVPEVSLDAQTTSDKSLDWLRAFLKKAVWENKNVDSTFHLYVKYALRKIDTQFADKTLSLQKIAKSKCISAAYLGKLFKEQTGEYFNDYLLKKRLEMALELLCDDRLNIGTIAADVGFSSQSYFNKMFRRNYGIAPAEYRRKLYEGRKL